jgi:hypothetical protein
MHDILISLPVELVGMLKSHLNARYLNSHWTSGVGGNAKFTMHDILFFTVLVGMQNHNLMHDILIPLSQWVGGNAKITKCTIS